MLFRFGPFDAIRMDSYGSDAARISIGRGVNYRATCTFGTSVTISQIALLRALAKKYDQVFILFDQGAEKPAADLADWVGAKVAHLPSHVKDPGDLTSGDLGGFADIYYDGWQKFSGIGAVVGGFSSLIAPPPIGINRKPSTVWSNKKSSRKP